MPWKKGESGNPGGVPKKTDEWRLAEKLAREHTTTAIKTLVRICESDNPGAAVTAATALLNRGWGQPKQQIDLNTKVTLIDMLQELANARRSTDNAEPRSDTAH